MRTETLEDLIDTWDRKASKILGSKEPTEEGPAGQIHRAREEERAATLRLCAVDLKALVDIFK